MLGYKVYHFKITTKVNGGKERMMKKILAAVLTLSIAFTFTPVGNFVFQDHDQYASAKSYKSGKRGFGGSNKSNFQNTKKNDTHNNAVTNKNTTDKKQTNTAATNKKGGFMKGMLFGGLAGLLLGGLLSGMGPLGAVLGLLINVIAIVAVIMIIRKIYLLIKNKRKDEEDRAWRN